MRKKILAFAKRELGVRLECVLDVTHAATFGSPSAFFGGLSTPHVHNRAVPVHNHGVAVDRLVRSIVGA
jgi:hypothetical protein